MKMALSEQDKSLEPVKVPHSLHSFKRVSPKDPLHQEGRLTFRGGFWNYFSIGMDAQVAYEFHSRREKEPQKFKNQFRNQTRYWWLTCRQGWFCASCIHPSSRNIPQLAKIKIAKHAGEWEELKVLSSIRSIVVLNLPSFSGGLNPWGKPGDKQSKERGLTPPFVNDGLLEIVGFRDACHGMVLFSPNGHGVRLAQAHKVKIEFHSGAANHTYLRMDGEPWFQPLTSGHKKTVLEISHLGQALLLVTPDCIAKPASNLPPGVTGHSEQTGSTIPAGEGEGGVGSLSATAFGKSSSFSDSDDSPKRKFGAASTFKGMIQ